MDKRYGDVPIRRTRDLEQHARKAAHYGRNLPVTCHGGKASKLLARREASMVRALCEGSFLNGRNPVVASIEYRF
jgi:hypothetical protein